MIKLGLNKSGMSRWRNQNVLNDETLKKIANNQYALNLALFRADMEEFGNGDINNIFTNMDLSYNAFRDGLENNAGGMPNNISNGLYRTHITGSQDSYNSTKVDYQNGDFATTSNNTIPVHTETRVKICDFDQQGTTEKVLPKTREITLVISSYCSYSYYSFFRLFFLFFCLF